jgi:hypothetical protein
MIRLSLFNNAFSIASVVWSGLEEEIVAYPKPQYPIFSERTGKNREKGQSG